MLRELLENLLEYLLTNDTLRNIVKQLAGKANLVENKKYCRLISPENVVLSGPFTGMKYPKLKAIITLLALPNDCQMQKFGLLILMTKQNAYALTWLLLIMLQTRYQWNIFAVQKLWQIQISKNEVW